MVGCEEGQRLLRVMIYLSSGPASRAHYKEHRETATKRPDRYAAATPEHPGHILGIW